MKLRARRGGDQARGFSMIEISIVLAIAMIVMAIAIIHLQPTLQQMQADAAKNVIQSALRQARELAISDRRFVKVEFLVNPPANRPGSYVRLTRVGGPVFGPDLVVLMLPIQSNVSFVVFGGLPDTPDGFGKAAPIYFGGVANGPAAGMMYQSDGTFVDSTGVPINGTVFLGMLNQPNTARAITVLGSTGRVRSYHSAGVSWMD
ncbi:MAG: prepilin-type N-terminal cleavage/methylation domain-containing protein [Candidatus Acidiferrales bacterium]